MEVTVMIYQLQGLILGLVRLGFPTSGPDSLPDLPGRQGGLGGLLGGGEFLIRRDSSGGSGAVIWNMINQIDNEDIDNIEKSIKCLSVNINTMNVYEIVHKRKWTQH